jgi:malonyl-CoA O-methyltransferase
MKSAPILLSAVRQFFSRPARLNAASFIFREISKRMIERLELVRLDPEQVVDAGCGDGSDVALLQCKFPKAQVIGVDGSVAMLQHALRRGVSAVTTESGLVRAKRLLDKWWPSAAKVENNRLVCADFSNLPFGAQHANVLWSNLALHWHPQPDVVFAEWRRVLKVDGLLMFSCFGPDTLKEIRLAFQDVDQAPHTLPFVDMHDFGDMLTQAGFATPVMDMEVITLTYTTVAQLIAEVRALGGNPLANRRQGLMGRSAWKKMCDNLEKQRQPDGRIALTLEIIYGHAFKPQAKRTADGESIIKFHSSKK